MGMVATLPLVVTLHSRVSRSHASDAAERRRQTMIGTSDGKRKQSEIAWEPHPLPPPPPPEPVELVLFRAAVISLGAE